MSEENIEAVLEKARVFFQRAEDVAATENYDYAIDLYFEGLRLCPDALEDGHAPLRKIALLRQGKGGKKPAVIDKIKHRGGKSPLDEMLNAEYLLAKEPDHLSYAEAMLKAAVAGSYTRTAEWIAQLVFDANRAADRPSLATYLQLKDSYHKLGMYAKAVAACEKALELKPNSQLQDELRDLEAQMTVEKGGYGKGRDFRDSILDRDKQDKLHSQENIIKSEQVRRSAVEEARSQVAQMALPTNIMKLADALADEQSEQAYAEAVKILEDAYIASSDFAFKRKQGEIRIRQMKNEVRTTKAAFNRQPEDSQLKKKLADITAKLESTELEHYKLCAENYPTDLKLKYEYGRCLIKDRQYDLAIPQFQEAQRDPRYRISAMDRTGLCFFLKGWHSDAADIFRLALDECEVKDSPIAKEIRYNLARSYEADGKMDQAIELYRKLAQLDFGFKDIKDRIENLRRQNT